MVILHYFLGFPPYRSGGMTIFAYDLMRAQKKDGYEVAALWPGQMKFLSSETKVVARKPVEGILNYELVNPLPVSLDEGILDIEAYTKHADEVIYRDFLRQLNPQVIHIHTLMGLHREFLMAAKKMGIRTVFTSHDYFGICPKVNLYYQGKACTHNMNCENCEDCNSSALSIKKIMLMQSPLYRILKNSYPLRVLRKRHRQAFFDETKETIQTKMSVEMENNNGGNQSKSYQKLRAYYISMLTYVDLIHFNSSLAENIYNNYLIPKESRIVTITNGRIKEQRVCSHTYSNKLRITMLSPAKPFKGYDILCRALDELWQGGKCNFTLTMYSPVPIKKPYMEVFETGFDSSMLPELFKKTDILVVPSIWYETFGFTVIEALSYGCPVLVSDHVGAKDIIGEGGIIYPANDKEALKKAILSLDQAKLSLLREKIKEGVSVKTYDVFMKEIYALYSMKDTCSGNRER